MTERTTAAEYRQLIAGVRSRTDQDLAGYEDWLRRISEWPHSYGILWAYADQMIADLEELERQVASRKAHVDPLDLPALLHEYADSLEHYGLHFVHDHSTEQKARAFLAEQGYLPDEEPRQQDTEKTVGPIRDHGNPFEDPLAARCD